MLQAVLRRGLARNLYLVGPRQHNEEYPFEICTLRTITVDTRKSPPQRAERHMPLVRHYQVIDAYDGHVIQVFNFSELQSRECPGAHQFAFLRDSYRIVLIAQTSSEFSPLAASHETLFIPQRTQWIMLHLRDVHGITDLDKVFQLFTRCLQLLLDSCHTFSPNNMPCWWVVMAANCR
jgi:hypothetical protein